MLDAELKVDVLNTLKRLQNEDKSQFKNSGICEYLWWRLPSHPDYLINESLYSIFKRWESFSGDINYPVPSKVTAARMAFYDYEESMWVGEYGTARLDLLNFLVTELGKEILQGMKGHNVDLPVTGCSV